MLPTLQVEDLPPHFAHQRQQCDRWLRVYDPMWDAV